MPTCRACCRCWTPPASSRPRPRRSSPLLAGFDLRRRPSCAAAPRRVYRHALGYALLPRLIWRLEAQMRGYFTQPDFLYEATRVYLMLGGQGPLDQVAGQGMDDLRLAGPVFRRLATWRWSPACRLIWMRSSRSPLPAVPLDEALVAKARTTFSRVSLASRAYSRIKPSAAAQNLPPWRPSDAIGRAGGSVFTRASGKKLSDGIPGFLTVDGFHKVLLPALATATREVASESWVLGQKVPVNFDLSQAKRGRERGRQAVHGGLRQGVGRPAAGPRDRAAAQPEPGLPGSLHPGVEAVAVEGAAGGHRPAAHAVGAARSLRLSRRQQQRIWKRPPRRRRRR